MLELTEASKHSMVEETNEGLKVEIGDQDGRQGRYRSAVPRRLLHDGQPPRHHHADA
jgi:hypothetical protein